MAFAARTLYDPENYATDMNLSASMERKARALVARWYKLRYHAVQSSLWRSPYRFNVVPSGRRSGKTELLGKRKLVLKALKGSPYMDGRYFAAAPTRDQAKRIYWKDLKMLTPPWLMGGPPSESNLMIPLINGSEIHVLGMDKPERVEGSPWDHGILDEIGNMKPDTWPEHVRPALADRHGSCDFIGVPEGRNHYYDLYKNAQADDTGNWGVFHWMSSDILPEEEIEQAKLDLDELTFQQEFGGLFVMFSGAAYYNFDEKRNQGAYRQFYDRKKPLVFCFDFNESPGVAAIIQELPIKISKKHLYLVGKTFSAVIGEVHIPRNSNTIKVCDKLWEDWKRHRGPVICYGDSTGGAGGSAKVQGSDWDLVKKVLKSKFGDRISFRVPKQNPRERARVNAVNSRLKNTVGQVFLGVDPKHAPMTVKDFEGVRVVEGGTGEIDKSDKMLTHLTDAIGYYIAYEYPVRQLLAPKERYWK